jgi:soluble lytic murein transglycosylase-like protein
MESLRNYVLLGAVVGSLLLASFANKVMASVSLPVAETVTDQIEPTGDGNQSQNNAESQEKSKKKKKENKAGAEEGCKLSQNYPESIRQWCNQITRHATERNIDPNLIAAVMLQESGGNPAAYSKSGAVGLMQVMPRDGIASSFQCVNGPCFASRPSIQELQDPEFNVKYGTGMLSGLVNRHGNVRDALRAYGPMDVGYYYADKVLGIYQSYTK